jgi:histidine ammonia-lyase
MAADTVNLTAGPLGFKEVEAVARRGAIVSLDPAARVRVRAGRVEVELAVGGGAAVYGVNTGFGSLSRTRIDSANLRELQVNLIRSHAAGVGEALPDDVVRAMMLILAASLSRGCSGVRQIVIEAILGLLNQGVTPVVPSRGSVGASGDLAPLAHAALVLLGEGEASVRGKRVSGRDALAAAGLKPLALEAKEGLALINGTHLMAAIGTLALCDVQRLTKAAIATTALAIDACRATDAFLDDRLHDVRNQPGQQRVAGLVKHRLSGSQIVQSHKRDDPRVQDPYSLRASPQVLGAVMDAIEFVRGVFERELGAVTDNPLVFASGSSSVAQATSSGPALAAIISGGNFHGMPLAIAFDTLKIALCHLAGIAERRVFWVLSPSDPQNPVPAYLAPGPGLQSGLMIAQYTAAACCNEMQTLAAPASVGNIPTSAGIEDYNSMGATAAHQARAAIDLAHHVIAIELLVMAEALEYQRPLRSGAGVERTYAAVRARVPRLTADRPPASDIAALAQAIREGAFAE